MKDSTLWIVVVVALLVLSLGLGGTRTGRESWYGEPYIRGR